MTHYGQVPDRNDCDPMGPTDECCHSLNVVASTVATLAAAVERGVLRGTSEIDRSFDAWLTYRAIS